jgi:FMN phosphatase YigB (HAD superfamily)
MKLDPAAIQVVAFDVHDTLAYWPVGGPRKAAFAIQQQLAEHDIEISYQSFVSARAMLLTFDTAHQRLDDAYAFLRAIFARLDVKLPADVLDAVVETYQQHLPMRLFDESVEVVAALHRMPLRTCTFTTLPSWHVSDALAPLWKDLDEYFDNHRAGWPKGHPKFYCSIARQLGVQPSAILAIGNEPEGDVIIPSSVGWQCVHLQRKGRNEPLPGAVAAVGDLRELLVLLGKI